jgi:5-(carboxyamino)imidazole ribonucleotide synthase
VNGGVLLPGSTIGIVGGGQLGRMLAFEAVRMGYRTIALDPEPRAPAAQVTEDRIVAALGDEQAMTALAERADVVTIEWENVEVSALRQLEALAPLRPSPDVLAVAQNRLLEKTTAQRLGLPTAKFMAIGSLDELERGLAELGSPALLKANRGGYDGRGQRRIANAAGCREAWEDLGGGSQALILEELIGFRAEASVICARSPDGSITSFEMFENMHADGILEATIAPARLEPRLHSEARQMAEALTEELGVVGLLAVEMFITQDDRLLINEIAPRPHNSGHLTIEGCMTSQFEQHLRAICGLPLGAVEPLRPAAMVNLLGHETGTGLQRPGFAHALAVPGVAVHLYGKAEPRPGRKMGHLTALADTPGEALAAARRAKAALMGDDPHEGAEDREYSAAGLAHRT